MVRRGSPLSSPANSLSPAAFQRTRRGGAKEMKFERQSSPSFAQEGQWTKSSSGSHLPLKEPSLHAKRHHLVPPVTAIVVSVFESEAFDTMEQSLSRSPSTGPAITFVRSDTKDSAEAKQSLRESITLGGLSGGSRNGESESSTTTVKNRAPCSSPSAKSANTKSFGYLDGLRGIAMIMVFNVHFIDNTFAASHPQTVTAGTPVALIRHPMGLTLFFILTGRLNTSSWFRKKRQGKNLSWDLLPDAIVRRSIRLLFMAGLWLLLQQIQCASHAFDKAVEAEGWLQTGVLGYPQWCRIEGASGSTSARAWHVYVTFSDVLGGLLRLCTDRDHSSQLLRASMLWSIYPQFWGMISVLMLLPVILHMHGSRRFFFYGAIIILQGWTFSQCLPFLIGMIGADLKESGYMKTLQDKSRFAYVCLEVALSGFLLTTLCYNPIEVFLNRSLAAITDRDGILGYDISSFMAGRGPAFLFEATMFYFWIDMSPVLQWLVGNFLFKELGRVALGFYVSQMSVIYGVMPHLVLHFRDSGESFWNTIIYTWTVCLLLNYIVGWVLTKTIDRWAKKFGTWFYTSLRNKDSLTIAREAVLNTFNFVYRGPGRLAQALPLHLKENWSKAGRIGWVLFHWRTTSPAPLPPSHPLDVGLQISQLHSSLFDADIADNPRAKRTQNLLIGLSLSAPFNLIFIFGIGFIWMWFNPWHGYVLDGFADFSTLWRILWILALPYCLITTLGAAVPDVTWPPSLQSKKKVVREYVHRFFIVTVTKGTNPETTTRCHLSLKELEKYHSAVKAIVLTDEPHRFSNLESIMTPESYRSPLGRAKHKARALDYFRASMNLTAYDWVLHMDEESTMDAESLRGCLDFIRFGKAHLGQGIITYNGYKYWDNWFFTVADCIRVGDELGRFSLQSNLIKRPVFGVHGSFLLVNGQVENDVTWDFGSLAEDFEFSQAAWKKGYTLGRIHGVVREQSPKGWKDFLKQRRRWYMGIRSIDGMFLLPQIAIKIWTAGIFCLVATLINIPFSLLLYWSGPTPRWLYYLCCFTFGTFYWLYYAGFLLSEIDHGYRWHEWWKVPVHAVALFVLQPIVAFTEGCAVIWAMSTEDDEVGFQIVKK
ncbi:hypothetical protein IE53DRAFT_51821 [Violaceomyces palustris]|uniref:Uncharacterized protein n=1 Tax=Violaceomyces palustris TaxID=1673888 RepID=A0ACD0P0D6_9BASI|nr:hypothetical protein IE53DRAFT_51821 [Violaceomyces palustris]